MNIVLKILLVCACLTTNAAFALTTNPPVGRPDRITNLLEDQGDHFLLKLANRPIFEFRGSLQGYSAQERHAAADVRLQSVLAEAKTVLVSTQAVKDGIQVCLDGKSLFVITPEDLKAMEGETLESTAAKVKGDLDQAILEKNTLSSKEKLVKAILRAGFLTLTLVVVLWLIVRVRKWLQLRITRLAAEKSGMVKSIRLRRVGMKGFVAILRTTFNLLSWLFIAFFLYSWFVEILRCFPYLRPMGEMLRKETLAMEQSLLHGMLGMLPGLLVVAVLVVFAKILTQIIKDLFQAVEEGDVETFWLDRHTASTTRRIIIFLIWVGTVVIAYPYIPGSDTVAFKGVTVFAGLVFSLGSTNLINQIASGILIVYSRAFRTGDYVRFGDIEGTVIKLGLCSTYIQTVKNEEMHIANSVLLSGSTKNFSRLAETEGLLISAKVTIGYATPWRQVEAMLIEAAQRTEGLLPEPRPFVLQTSLADFYVEYELNARLARPNQRVFVLAKLHASILDVFNANGVQIMSPHYFADPPSPHVVPRSNWFLPPAKEEKTRP